MPEKLLDIEVLGLRDMQGRFAKIAGNQGLKKIRREEFKNLGKKSVKLLRAEAPVRTGDLRKGITFKTIEKGNETDLKITSKMFYTKWVLKGRGPVFAKTAKALRFEPGPPGSGFIFRKSVGPAKPNPFVDRAMEVLRPEGVKTGRRIASRVERIFAHG